jgi:hypothetical protein
VQLLRVGKVHYAQHGSRLLMGRATITRKGVLTIGVTSSKTKTSRTFDVEDGPDGQITEQIDQTDQEVVPHHFHQHLQQKDVNSVHQAPVLLVPDLLPLLGERKN